MSFPSIRGGFIMVEADIEALKHVGTHWIDKVSLESWGTK